MHEKPLCTRQICFLFAAVLPVTRMLAYPSTVAYIAKNDLILSAAIAFLLELIAVALGVFAAKKSERTFYERLQMTFGTVAARTISILFSLFFLFSALLPILEQRGFVLHIFYENVPSYWSFLPFFAVTAYACTKGLRGMGRVADIALPIFSVSVFALFLLAIPETDFLAPLPIGYSGTTNILKGALFGANWFCGGAYMLFFLGNFRCKQKDGRKILLSYGIGAAVVLLFLYLFYGIFEDISVMQQHAIADISKYATAFTAPGRIDLLFVFALAAVMLFALCLPLQLSTHAIADAFGCKPVIPAVLCNAILLILTVVFNRSFSAMQRFMTQKAWYVYLFFALIVPIAATFLKTQRHRNRHSAVSVFSHSRRRKAFAFRQIPTNNPHRTADSGNTVSIVKSAMFGQHPRRTADSDNTVSERRNQS